MTPLKDLTIWEGERARFEAKITPVGDPSMTVEWYMNGTPVTASSRINTICQFGYVALDMLNAALRDGGEYTCEVRTNSGVVHSTGRLTVQAKRDRDAEAAARAESLRHTDMKMRQTTVRVESEPLPDKPKFVRGLVDLRDKPEGSTVHLEAQVNPISDHTMRIEWLKDGKAITASSRIGTIFSFGYVSLNITDLRAEDAGYYVCKAINATGEATTQARISVKATTELTGSTGIVEQEKYIQQVNLLEQQQAAKSSLMDRSESMVESTQPPEFKTPIKDQNGIREGGFAHFEARLEPMGDQHMKVEWFKDGRQVAASSRITTFFNFGYVALTIKQVGASDAGSYTCVATNKCGRAETSARMTTVSELDSEAHSKAWSSIQQMEASKKMQMHAQLPPEPSTTPPRFLSQLKGTNVILEGQRAHFECRLEPQSDPTLTVQWLLNGRELKASSRIQTYHDFGYVAIDILDVHKEDAGRYTLVAKNSLGSEQAHIDLRVEAHAQSVDHSTMHAKTVEETRKFEIKQQRQELPDIPVSQSRPIFKTPLQNPKPVLEGQNIHLEARLEPIGDPTMKIDWFFNNKPLTIGSRFRTYHDFGFIALDIVGVNTTDAGQYVCRATNSLGSADTTARVEVSGRSNVVTESEHQAALQQIHYLEADKQQAQMEDVEVRQPPQFTKNLRNVEALEGQNVHLEARLLPTGDSTMRINWTVNGQPLKTGKI